MVVVYTDRKKIFEGKYVFRRVLDEFGQDWTSLDKVSGEFSRQLGIAEVLANYLKTTLYDKKLTCLNGKR